MRIMETVEQIKTDTRNMLEQGSHIVYCVLRSVSQSGMSRRISFFTIIDNQPRWLDWKIEQILGYKRRGDKEGLFIEGCGMDMGFHVVYSLSQVLYGIDHNNAYKLTHQWI